MGRILGIDYGAKRCGIAVTDPLQIIVNSLAAIETDLMLEFILNYVIKENVEKIVIGHPKHADNTDTYLVSEIKHFANQLKSKIGDVEIELVDERLTSIHASKIILQSGIPKKKRQEKERIDQISAVLILQKYLGHI